MPIIEATTMPGLLEYYGAGVPAGGTDEVQTITFGGTWLAGETFKLSFNGFTTAAIAWSATNNTLRDNVDTALEALPTIGTGGVVTAVGTMTAGIGTLTVTFATNLAKKAVNTIGVANNGSASGTLAVAETTPGVDAAFRGAAIGATYQDTTNGKLYVNTGTAIAPVWTVVGTQT
jgi:hypothetical protein